jgi:hypothetical protein
MRRRDQEKLVLMRCILDGGLISAFGLNVLLLGYKRAGGYLKRRPHKQVKCVRGQKKL